LKVCNSLCQDAYWNGRGLISENGKAIYAFTGVQSNALFCLSWDAKS